MNESQGNPAVPSQPSNIPPKISVPLNQSNDSMKKLNQPIRKQVVFVFIIATLGVFAAFGTFFIMNQFSSQDLSQVDETLAWRPTVTGACQTGNIKLGPEPDEFDVVLTATKGNQSQTLNFSSGPDKQLDEDFQWPFTVANGDVVSWNVKVTWNSGEENHQGQVTIAGCTTQQASPSPTGTSYSEPEYPACPANSQRLTVNGSVANSSADRTKSHTLTVAGSGQITSMVGFKMEGHPDEGCKAGSNNDNGTYPCDQGQLNEGFNIKVNGSAYGTVNDEGAGKDDEWFDFSITRNAQLTSGNNTIVFEHVGGNGTGSVEYKTSICYTLGATATATPQATASPTARATATAVATARATATPVGTPGTGGPIATPTVAPTRTPSVTATPAPTQVSLAITPPAPGGDGRSDGLGCAENDCSGNQPNRVEQNKAVADAGTTNTAAGTTKTLPDAGVANGIIMLVLGSAFILLGIALGRRNLIKE